MALKLMIESKIYLAQHKCLIYIKFFQDIPTALKIYHLAEINNSTYKQIQTQE